MIRRQQSGGKVEVEVGWDVAYDVRRSGGYKYKFAREEKRRNGKMIMENEKR